MTGTRRKPAILVVSFGTSYRESIDSDIGSVERAIAAAFPGCALRRAFTSRMIIEKLKRRDGMSIDHVGEAMRRLHSDGFDTVVIQPTHVMSGFEYDKMLREAEPYEGLFCSVRYGRPLLGEGRDYDQMVKILAQETASYDDGRTAVVCIGHGTEHAANAVYARLDACFKRAGLEHLYVGTVEALPSLEDTEARVQSGGYRRVVLLPLMIVAGDHAYSDMAGDGEASWKSRFLKAGYEVVCVLKGIGQCPGVQRLFTEHVRDAAGKSSKTGLHHWMEPETEF